MTMQAVEISVPFFGWCPPEVVRIADTVYRSITTDWELEIFNRLMYAHEMRSVWKELLAENRKKGGYLHPVIGGSISARGPADAQQRVCGRVFYLAYGASRDRIEASKESENAVAQQKVIDDAAGFRKTADALAANGLRDPDASAGAAAALRLALVKEEESRRMIAHMRDSQDPLTITNERGSRVVRGVASIIGTEMMYLFGKPMSGTVRILTQVGLNQKTTLQEVRTSTDRSRNLRLS